MTTRQRLEADRTRADAHRDRLVEALDYVHKALIAACHVGVPHESRLYRDADPTTVQALNLAVKCLQADLAAAVQRLSGIQGLIEASKDFPLG